MAERDFIVCLVGDRLRLRNPRLIEQIETELRQTPEIIGVFPLPSELSQMYNEDAAKGIHGSQLSCGEVGCWQSHRRAYQVAKRFPSAIVLVLEDDAVIAKGFGEALRFLLGEFGAVQEPAILTLFDAGADPENLMPLGRRRKKRADRDQSNAKSVRVKQLMRPKQGTVGYLINNAGVQVALSVPPQAVTAADWPTWSGNIKWFVAEPSLIGHGPEQSLIDSTRTIRMSSRQLLRALEVVSLTRWFRYRRYYPNFYGYARREFLFRFIGKIGF